MEEEMNPEVRVFVHPRRLHLLHFHLLQDNEGRSQTGKKAVVGYLRGCSLKLPAGSPGSSPTAGKGALFTNTDVTSGIKWAQLSLLQNRPAKIGSQR